MEKKIKLKFVFFCAGFALGLVIGIAYSYIESNGSEYYELKNDYCISNKGVIKSGSLIKFDKAMPENYSRYIIYLNIHDSEEIIKYRNSKRGLIIPYWLNPANDSVCVKVNNPD